MHRSIVGFAFESKHKRYGGTVTTARQFRSRLAYPNPFSPSGIEFDLPETARVSLKILDAAGREVMSLIEGASYNPGTHRVDFEPSLWNHSHGELQKIFYYQLSIQIDGKNYIDTKQILLSKQ